MALSTVCIYAGSNRGSDPAHAVAAERLGRLLAAQGIGIIYGGGRVGLMGVIADSVLEAGGTVVGVIPESLHEREITHTGLTELHVVASMHERKAMMADRADAFIALPGGLGTIEELVEAATWTQLGIHRKPVGLLDSGTFWRPLEVLLDHAVDQGFLRAEHREAMIRVEDPESLLARLQAWQPVHAHKWLELDER